LSKDSNHIQFSEKIASNIFLSSADKNLMTGSLLHKFFPSTIFQNEYGLLSRCGTFSLNRFYKRRKSRFSLLAFGFTFAILFLTVIYYDMIPTTNLILKQSKHQVKIFCVNCKELLKIRNNWKGFNIELESDHVSSQYVTYDSILRDNFSFNINGSDVMVFLHIQKTGITWAAKNGDSPTATCFSNIPLQVVQLLVNIWCRILI